MGQPVRVQVPPSASPGPPGRRGALRFPCEGNSQVDPPDADNFIVGTESGDNGRHRTIHVLVVDDNPEILEVLTELLEMSGYQVTCCSRGLSALLTIGRVQPDVVVLDIKLDDISGFDVYRALRAEAAFADLPVIFVSGVFLDEEMIRGRLGDTTARLLLKPIPGERLIMEIEQATAGRLRAA